LSAIVTMPVDTALEPFLPVVGEWFQTALGSPTLPQSLGWPVIRSGRHTLILAPTGSGKTLAAFLACLDDLWRQPDPPPGVQVLYISPLKALNNDIYRNLQVPLDGIAATARQRGVSLPEITVGLRTGDTPAAERQRLLRRPPHVLITTPESLHLLLTSQARRVLTNVRYCIVDEIHALSPNKRGVFLSLLLERLETLVGRSFVRIGLSATQRPLEEVARFLGGCQTGPNGVLEPRPVTIVDAGLRKDLDLKVVAPVDQFGPLPEKSIWPSIYRLLTDLVRQHRSTLIFANNRRVVERITANLNAEEELAKAHHGSVALEVRRATEEALKAGRLPAVAATASLELGIDMGAVDLVCQVESPGSVARALQRVGRAGHLVGKQSKGRLIPKTPADLLEQAVLAREMMAGKVEEIRVPINCLDVLAQQIVAMTAIEPWSPLALYQIVRRAYPYRDLAPEAFDTVLEMVSGRYRWQEGTSGPAVLNALQPRISWDRVHDRLEALPGSQRLALVSGGAIPDVGQYAAYDLSGVRIGELDEEFVYERRVGDTFQLGTNSWRVEKIEVDRVLVAPVEGIPSQAPFWRGEKTARSWDLGQALGRFRRELSERVDEPGTLDWLQGEYHLDVAAAHNARSYVRRQLASGADLPTDRTLVVEAARDPLGDWQIVFLSPSGSRIHLGLRLAIEARLRQRLGYAPQCLHHDDGILVRLTDTEEPVLDLLDGITPENVESLVLAELADSPLFALRFRQNAARALLLPRTPPGKRAPLWLQRLRGRDLLQLARGEHNFPIVAETFRECLHDHLDMPRLVHLLEQLTTGQIKLIAKRREGPSPFASGLLFAFNMAYMYQYDDAEAGPNKPVSLDPALLEQLVRPESHAHLLDPRAIQQVERRLRGLGRPPRTTAEMAEWLRRLGDVCPDELEGPMARFVEELLNSGQAASIELPGRPGQRWILAEEAALYRAAFGVRSDHADAEEAATTILARFLNTHALVSVEDVERRYPFERDWILRQFETWTRGGHLEAAEQTDSIEPPRWAAPTNLTQVRRSSLALLRRDVRSCSPSHFAEFVTHWQRCHPSARRGELEGLELALDRLEGLALPWEVWERAVLPARVPGLQKRWLDELLAGGTWCWHLSQPADADHCDVALCTREEIGRRPPPSLALPPNLSPAADSCLDCLRRKGALFQDEISHETGIPHRQVREALWELLSCQLLSNDRLDLVRQGRDSFLGNGSAASLPDQRSSLLRRRRREKVTPDGRWFMLCWGRPEAEQHAVSQAGLLLQRYGIAARELALLDPSMPPWRILYEVLGRMELTGEVRRGYFAEGLSGAQFALPEAVAQMQELEPISSGMQPALLLHSLDPANLFGSAAPFDIPLLEGGTRPWTRRLGSWIVQSGGKPIVLIEQHGKRLTALAHASPAELRAAIELLPTLPRFEQNGSRSSRITVATWNEEPVTQSEGKDLLGEAGFVRDYQQMTYYPAWT
jgi:ATP-dependent helicase Lhr and Lhr-like helicase